MVRINKNIVPIVYSGIGGHPERKFQEKIRGFLSSYHIEEIPSSIVHNEFSVFDLLIFPQYSPVRTSKNVIYLPENFEIENKIDKGLFKEVCQAHKQRFGFDLDIDVSKRPTLLSHTTASIADNLVRHGPREIFVLSKVFRNKSERREKIQLEIALCNRSIPEIITFAQSLYSHILGRPISVTLGSNFFYFCEPSFTFRIEDGRNKSYMLGAAGFMREELLDIINRKHRSSESSVVYIGISYQKLLNLFLDIPPGKYDVDYNDF